MDPGRGHASASCRVRWLPSSLVLLPSSETRHGTISRNSPYDALEARNFTESLLMKWRCVRIRKKHSEPNNVFYRIRRKILRGRDTASLFQIRCLQDWGPPRLISFALPVALTIARMPARIATGSPGHRSTRASRSGAFRAVSILRAVRPWESAVFKAFLIVSCGLQIRHPRFESGRRLFKNNHARFFTASLTRQFPM